MIKVLHIVKHLNQGINKENSLNQQNAYLKMSAEIKEKYPNIHVVNLDTSAGLDNFKDELKEKLDWKE